MIFVTLGTQKFQLNRLLKKLDELYEKKELKEKIFAQIGHSDYVPRNYDYVDFLDREIFLKKIQQSSLVITHSGVGSIIAAINENKPVIVVPRLREYNEHVDDHQCEIAEAFSKKNYVLCCKDLDDLEEMIVRAKNHTFDKYVSSTDKILNIVENALLEGKR